MVKGRVGTFLEAGSTVLDNGMAFADIEARWWHVPGREKYYGVSNVYDGTQPVLDSLTRVYPDSRCVLADSAAAVDCLRIPVHVEDQLVWTDSLGYFVAGPFLEGTEIRAWVDHTKLPLFQARPGGMLQCDDRLDVGTACGGIISLFNWQYRWKGYNHLLGRDSQVDTVRVLVGETNTREWDPRTRTHTWPEHFVIPAWNTSTGIIRLPKALLGERMRIFGQPRQGEVTGTLYEANWNGEVILREEDRSLPWSYIQLRGADDREMCGKINMRNGTNGPPSSINGSFYVDYLGDTRSRWKPACSVAPPNSVLYRAWQPPPPLYP